MRKELLVISTTLLILQASALSMVTAQAQSAGKKSGATKPKAAAQKPAKPAGPVVLGTTQMAGDFGKLGTTYTIGKSTPI
ncbi:MAG: hypothetical protein H7145_21320, partial [Akkermansiaceae bacterium]|nr:hypothetical protein [Armatimonadota bacterium]